MDIEDLNLDTLSSSKEETDYYRKYNIIILNIANIVTDYCPDNEEFEKIKIKINMAYQVESDEPLTKSMDFLDKFGSLIQEQKYDEFLKMDIKEEVTDGDEEVIDLLENLKEIYLEMDDEEKTHIHNLLTAMVFVYGCYIQNIDNE